jgi:cyclase
MLKVRVIPCLDVAGGRVVKGVNFVDLRDAGDPVEQASVYDKAGADELCFLDIGASVENRDIMLDVVARTAERCFMPLTVGGGVRNLEDIRRLLLAGADKVSINSAAIADPDLVRRAAEKFGSQCVTVAMDAKAIAPGKWALFSHGGRNATGLDALAWAMQVTELGAGEILLTSMDRDGQVRLRTQLTRAIADGVDAPVIASGGVGGWPISWLDSPGHASSRWPSIFHFGQFSIAEAKAALADAGDLSGWDKPLTSMGCIDYTGIIEI